MEALEASQPGFAAPVLKPRTGSGRGGKTRTGNGFTRQRNGCHKEGVRRARSHQERARLMREAWQLYCAGATFDQIGDQLGFSGKHAWVLCRRMADGILAEAYRDGGRQLVRALARTDRLVLSHWTAATATGKGVRPSADHAKVVLEALKHQARLLRLGAYGDRKDGVPVGIGGGSSVKVEVYLPDNGRDPLVVSAQAGGTSGNGADSDDLVALPELRAAPGGGPAGPRGQVLGLPDNGRDTGGDGDGDDE